MSDGSSSRDAKHESLVRPPREITPTPVVALPDDVVDAIRNPKNHFGDFVLVQPVGSGSAGVVYRAWQRSLRRYVALKLLHARAEREATFAVREAQIAASLSHPHIVPVYEVGTHDGRMYLTMRLIAGAPISSDKLTPERAARVMRDVAQAVEHAHRAGIIHRDLKPQNLLIDARDHVWVTDFGIARYKEAGATLTNAGVAVGTPAYMPPEQARGERVDDRSDVYALGATFYELLCGRPPFDGPSPVVVMVQQIRCEPTPPRQVDARIDRELEIIVQKAMAKNPAHRYPSAMAMAEDIQRHLDGEPLVARPPSLAVRAYKWARRHRLATTAFGMLGLLSVLIALYVVNVARARARAELQVGLTMIAEANALGAADRWGAARERYLAASAAFQALGVSSAAPELGLLDAHHHAPAPVLVLAGHAGPIREVVFLPDGKQVLSGGDDGTLRLWDVSNAREVRTFRGHGGAVNSVSLSADGALALSGGADGQVRLWRVADGTTLLTLRPRGGPVRKVALSPNGKRALSRTDKGVVQLWDATSGKELRSMEVAANRLFAVAFSPDGHLAFSGEPMDTAVRSVTTRANLWETESGQVKQTVGGFRAEVESVSFSPDGRRLVTAGFDQLVSVWDVESGRQLLSLKGHLHGLKGAAFSPRDRLIVSGGEDNAVKLWDADAGTLIRTLDAGHAALALAVSPDGRFVLTGGDDGTLRLWDLTVGQELRVFAGHEDATQGLAFSPDARLALSVGRDQKLRLWDVATGREVLSLGGHASSLHAAAFASDGRHVLAGGVDRQISLWDLRTGTKLRMLGSNDGTIRSLAVTPDSRIAASATERGELRLWNLDSGAVLRSWRHGHDVRSVAFSRDGRLLLSGSFDGTARIWDVASGQERQAFVTAPRERISAVAFSADGGSVVTGSVERTVSLWDVTTGKLVRRLVGHVGDIRGVRFSPDGKLVYSASRDRTLRIWEAATGRELHAFSWSSDAMWAFTLSNDGRFALMGNEDGSINFWDFTYVARYRALEAEVDAAFTRLHVNATDPEALATLGEWYAFRGVCSWAVNLFRRAEQGGARPRPLELGRCHWEEGDLASARRELQRAAQRDEAPVAYLSFITEQMRLPDQAARMRQLSLRDGRVRFPFLGILAGTPGDPGTRGARITRVLPDTAAARAGLHRGDLIVAVDQQRIESDAELGNYLATRDAGTVVGLTFMRNGEAIRQSLKLGERIRGDAAQGTPPVREVKTGWSLQTLSAELASSLGLDAGTRGVLIVDTGLNPPSELARRILPGDVLIRVAGRPVTNVSEAVAAIETLAPYSWDGLDVLRPGTLR